MVGVATVGEKGVATEVEPEVALEEGREVEMAVARVAGLVAGLEVVMAEEMAVEG